MIQTKEKFEIVADESLASAKFSLKDENLAHVFGILRSNLYSDKIQAIIREYSTNAYDANIENGLASNPVEITLPTVIDPVFKVRDRGRGISEEDIFEVYSSYGASTKRNTNELVGTLGMGSKSGFAYANSFTVTSFQNGIKKVYEAYIDETDLGTITKVLTDTTDEHDGIEISITVNASDIAKFASTAKKFFALWNPRPKFYGNDISEELDNLFSNISVVFDGKNATLYQNTRPYGGTNPFGNSNLVVNMGNIAYSVDSQYFSEIGAEFISGAYLVIKSKMGDFTFTTSRERLEMTPNTIKNLKKYIEDFKSELLKSTKAEIDALSTPWEAVCAFRKFSNIVQGAMLPTFSWRGTKLSTEIPEGFAICDYDTYRKQWTANKWGRVNVNVYSTTKSAFIVNDGGFPTYQVASRRMLAYAQLKEKGFTSINFLRTETVAESLTIKTNKMFEGATIVYLSSFSGNDVRRSKSVFNAQEKVFEWKGTTYFPYSSCWTSVDMSQYDKKSKGVQNVYVEIRQYMPKMRDTFVKPELLRHVTVGLADAGYPVKVFGVKKGQSIPKNWVSLEKYVESVYEKMLTPAYAKEYTRQTVAKARNGSVWSGLAFGEYTKLSDQILCPLLQKLSKVGYKPERDYVADVYNFVNGMVCVVGGLSNNIKMQKIIENANKLATEYGQDYDCLISQCPLITKLNNGYGYSNTVNTRDVINYVNAMWLLNQNHTKQKLA